MAALENHVQRPDYGSPFIPVLADEMQAEAFARRYRVQNPGQWCDVHGLNRSKFDMVYSTSVLVSELDINTERAALECESEYLVLQRHDPNRRRRDEGGKCPIWMVRWMVANCMKGGTCFPTMTS